MSPNEENQDQQVTTAAAGNQKLLTILMVVLIVLVSVGLVYYFFFGSNKSSAAKEDAEILKLNLDTFTVNLSDMEYRRYLRTDITLEFFTQDGLEEAQLKKHRIRDKIITLLNHKSVSDFNSSQKVEKCRLEMLNSINKILSENGQAKALYFENFIIQ